MEEKDTAKFRRQPHPNHASVSVISSALPPPAPCHPLSVSVRPAPIDNPLLGQPAVHTVSRILYSDYKPTISPALLSAVERASVAENLQYRQRHLQSYCASEAADPACLPLLNDFVHSIASLQPPSSASPGLSSAQQEYASLSRPVSPLRGRGRPPLNPPADGSAQRVHSCDRCDKSFPNNSALQKHKLIHSEERNFVCQVCQKAFKRQDHLNGHLNVHKVVKPFPCVSPDCDKSYCDARSLRRHLEHAHNIKNAVVQSTRGKIVVKCENFETLHYSKPQIVDVTAVEVDALKSVAPDTKDQSPAKRFTNACIGTNSRATSVTQDDSSSRQTPVIVQRRDESSGISPSTSCRFANLSDDDPSMSMRNERSHSSDMLAATSVLFKEGPCARCGQFFGSYAHFVDHVNSHACHRLSCSALYQSMPGTPTQQNAPSTSAYHNALGGDAQAFYQQHQSPVAVHGHHLITSAHSAFVQAHHHQSHEHTAPTPPFYDMRRQQNDATSFMTLSDVAPQVSFFEPDASGATPSTMSAVSSIASHHNLLQLPQSSSGVVAGAEPPIDLGPDFSKDVDDELIDRELQSYIDNNTLSSATDDPICDLGVEDGHHNPLDHLMRDSNSFYCDADDDPFYVSPERKRHMTAPSALNFATISEHSGYTQLTTPAAAGHRHHQQQPMLDFSHTMAPDAALQRGSAATNVYRPEAEQTATGRKSRPVTIVSQQHTKPKTRPPSRVRRKSKGKPDNVFMILSLAKKECQLSISPVRFRKQRFRPLADDPDRPGSSGLGRPAPLVLPPRSSAAALVATLNKFHSQLRSPRMWGAADNSRAGPHHSSSSSSGLPCGPMAPYTPPPILSPVRKGSGLFWRVNLPSTYWACLSNVGLTAGAKSAPISPKYRRADFWRKGFSPTKDKTSPSSSTIQSPLLEISGDVDNQIPETDTTPHINIGPSYQAFVDDTLSDHPNDPTELRSRGVHRAELLFDPFCLEERDEDEVENYLEFASSNGVYGACHNKEYALHLLQVTRGDLEKSVLMLMDPKTHYVNHDGYSYNDSVEWKADELQLFQDALLKHDKDFFLVASVVKSKSVKECVSFYYTWKKVFCDDNKRLKALRRRRDPPDDLTTLGGQQAVLEALSSYNTRYSAQSVALPQNQDASSVTDEHVFSPPARLAPRISIPSMADPSHGDVVAKAATCDQQRNDFDEWTTGSSNSLTLEANNAAVGKTVAKRGRKSRNLVGEKGKRVPRLPGEKTKRTNTNRDGYFPCSTCNKVFFKIKSRNAHMKSHSDKVGTNRHL